LQEANYTAARVHIRGVDHGVDMSEPGHVLVSDSYLVMCWLPASVTPPDGSHVDGIQTYCAASCTDLRLLHNTFDMRPDGKGTFVINIKDTHAGSVTVNDNLLAGGDNYVIVTQWRAGPNLVLNNNRVVNNTWGNTAPASGEGTCGHQSWQGRGEAGRCLCPSGQAARVSGAVYGSRRVNASGDGPRRPSRSSRRLASAMVGSVPTGSHHSTR
jgi:hypothetical protein